MTTLLALDTATEACSVALLHEGRVLSHYEVIPRQHAQRLLPMIQDLLGEAGVALSAVDAIAFGRGPGAFTGVRIAIGVVQGLAFALERPVLPVSNLAVLAQRAHREQGVTQVAAAIDARMDEVYWGCYRLEAGEMRLAGVEAVLPPEQVALPRDAAGDWFGAGTGWGTYGERLAVPTQGRDAALLPHAQDLLALAGFAWARGEAVAADAAQPVYLRDNVATPKAPA
ncbi:tRNA (adenosine(37)-N6)-threonylcarbamoyltransferase complex dimerization subunit type 1 TsaB [Pseudomonas otitidis]|uniref:tRNA threonylcarbamoyladenosine biosynthesis protein TsaB n=1 Tax=Metapseudomonas otitidis TaxID=319939 RepID=A0ABU3XSN8_9GAMM|nr:MULTISPECIES: tRNA (adenosine(37)-N6)-threonylcarbamoyltransferase complex dimerization subunit type 1 TsaB [Pseudomonas]MDL5598265.1 tRNA (adenosine(37)-N6)-threonylcarbamoyltransferase complex dimerization subunit type 1 TsaB [Bacillus subtilis]MDH0334866.1 tRNA (adenosine(37)-N6)-threonylcarbamoyltransferase complex dimerization subunit type 1 TsaB [Pseudomonas otitidis]MDH1107779.1 tRNA (adenosine(37)-N6)-threonylcarbamoyltransferase complex dimerization subunit type 1 TsaB [Pseudomonas o